ncbi:hypothetical protein [Winogradskyella sp. UBA3174]|uniref:hypothetical protein n=1 Tax=Winogradskyella sp. UBA3174 TaxID=1947785 RepID=UPI0025FE105A|nr:hypothetical protein [Winogradskyella sp. UBA3174]|tara:strand:- start:15962 stop:17560 length:1599 start_codon:yes stop_codon:yes gene_type:complete
MSDNKNIDRLFQEKFKDFEVAPNDAVWNRISESLPNTKKKRRVVPLWWQIGGVAAIIALLLTVGVSVFNSDENPNQNLPVVNTDKVLEDEGASGLEKAPKTKQEKLNTKKKENLQFVGSEKNTEIDKETSSTNERTSSDELTIPKAPQKNAVVHNPTNKEATVVSQKRNTLNTIIENNDSAKVASNTNKSTISNINNTVSNNSDKTKLASETDIKSSIKKSLENSKSAVVNNDAKGSNNSENNSIEKNASKDENTENSATENSLIEDATKQSIENAIAQNTDKPIIEKEEGKQSRWSIAPNVAPVYFSSLGQGSSLDMQFSENTKSSDINMSYGIAGTYAVSKKLKIRAGVNRVDLSQTTSDVFAFTGAETAFRGVDAQFSNIAFSNGVQTVSLMSAKMLDRSTSPELFNTKIAGNIDQRFGFIEVPLELEYRLVDKKFGVNVIGGFSTFFLNENEIYADIDGISTLIGEANNINGTSFSANFGLGFDYSLSKQWNINLEPTFKYQINTFNNTSGDFRPFFIGVYTGLSFKF